VAPKPVTLDRLLEAGLDSAVEGELLLVVDQFEELYTVADEEQRLRFLDLIVDAVEEPQSSTRVVVTLRADFYDRPLGDSRLGRLVRDGLLTVLPPSGDELLEMIVAPARGVGLRFEAGLPHRIIEDVVGQPGGLPLLQYALTEMVDQRSGDLITAADYERVGGVEAALATRAESLFRALTEGQQELARQVFLRMVTVGEESEETRRRVRRAELESLGHNRADLDTVLDSLIDQRLVISDRDPKTRGPTVEIAHEALLREWPRLAEWVEDQRDALIVGRRFRRAMADWESEARQDDYLLTGGRLAPYVNWAESTTLTPDELRFYRASQDKDRSDSMARTRRRRLITGVLAGGAVVAGILAAVAMVQANRANAEAEAAAENLAQALAAEALAEEQTELALEREQEALRERDRARASELSASATAALATDPSLAKLLAAASALAGEPSLDTLSVMHRALAADRIVNRYTGGEAADVKWFWTHLHPDGSRMVAGGYEEVPSTRLEVFDFNEARVLWGFDTLEAAIGIDRPRFTPDGSHVVAGLFWDSEDGGEPPRQHLGARIWNADTGSEVDHIDLGPCGGWVLDVSATHLLAGTMNGEDSKCFAGKFDPFVDVALELVDLSTGERQVLAPVFWGGGIFSGDGRRVAFSQRVTDPERSGPDFVTDVIDVATLERLLELDFDDAIGVSFLYANALNHDGSLLLASDRPIEVWDVNSRQRIATFDEHAGGARAVFSPAGDGTVYSVGQSAILRHWVATTGEEIASYPAIIGIVPSAVDGRVLVSDPGARAAVLLDVDPRGEVLVVPASCDGFMPNPLAIAGDFAVFSQFCTDDRKTIVVDLGKGELAYALPGHNAQGLAVSPDGTRFARQDANAPTVDGEPVAGNWLGPVRVRDIHTGSVVVEFQGLCTVDQVGLHPLVAQEGCAPLPEGPFPSWIWHLRWSPDGLLVAGIGTYGVAIVWDAHSGEVVHTYEGCDGAYGEHVIFTPDSSELVVFCKGRLVAFDTTSWAEVRASHPEGERGELGTLWLVGFTADESRLVGIGGAEGWSLFWIDPQTLDVDLALRTFEGQPKSWAMSSDLRLAAVGSADGQVRVWDLELRRVVHEIQAGATQVNGVAFVDDRRLAVVVQEGHLFIYTIDPAELLGMVRRSLTRGFTETECERYGFGDSCPTLEELRGDEPAS
jgi:WD40 repeat protein